MVCNKLASELALAIVIVLVATSLLISSGGAFAASTRRKDKDLANGVNCTNHYAIMHTCSLDTAYSTVDPKTQYPRNAQELRVSCARIPEGLKCFKTYVRCLNSIAQRTITAYINGRSRHTKRICSASNEDKAVEFVDTYECLRKTNKYNSVAIEEKRMIELMQHIQSVNRTLSWDDRFHHVCCTADKARDGMLRAFNGQCEKYKHVADDMLNSFIGDLLDVACPEAGKLAQICAKIKPLVGVKPWTSGSLTGSALDVIVSLSAETEEQEAERKRKKPN